MLFRNCSDNIHISIHMQPGVQLWIKMYNFNRIKLWHCRHVTYSPLLGHIPGGYSVQKTLRGRAHNMSSKISLLAYEWSLITCRIWYMNWLKFKKILEKNQAILLKLWAKIGLIGIWMGHFFFKNLYFYGSTFKFCSSMSLSKPNLSTPRVSYMLNSHFICCSSRRFRFFTSYYPHSFLDEFSFHTVPTDYFKALCYVYVIWFKVAKSHQI